MLEDNIAFFALGYGWGIISILMMELYRKRCSDDYHYQIDDDVMDDHMEESEYTDEWMEMTDEEKREYLDKDLDAHMSKRPKNESTDTAGLDEGVRQRRSFLSSIHL